MTGLSHRRSVHRRFGALVVMLSCAAAFAMTYVLADHTRAGQRADEQVFRVLYSLVPSGWMVDGLSVLARDVLIVVLAVAASVVAAVSVVRGRWRAVLRACVVTVLTVPVTPWLRDEVLTRHPFVAETFPLNSMPSTHASAAAALTAAVVVAWPGRRPSWLPNAALVLLGLVALGNIVGQAHRPSDVAASYFLVGAVVSATYVVSGLSSSRGGGHR